MEVLFHFIFQIFKIAILASIYSVILYKLLEQLNKIKPRNWITNVTSSFKRFYLKTAFIISIILFLWMFTYWGDHGIGDNARIPIGNGYEIENVNWTEYGYIENIKTSDGQQLETSGFFLEKGFLVGNLNSWFSSFNNEYFCLNIRTQKLVEFKTKEGLIIYLQLKNLSPKKEMKNFGANYSIYWHSWRFWLLP